MDDEATTHVKRPRILAIGRYMYRTNLPPLDDEVAPYVEGIESELGLETDDVAVETLESGALRCKLEIPRPLHGLVIGRAGSKVQGIEKDTGARIKAPAKRSKSTEFVIEADTMEKLDSARTRLQLSVDDATKKCAPTHFVSIPLNTPQLAESIEEFSKRVFETCGNSPGLSKELFIDTASFHLTLGVMKLFTEKDVEKAKDILESVKQECHELLADCERTISVRGLDVMQPQPEQAHVLYARVDMGASDKLQVFADAIAARYHSAGLFEEAEVKLHATLINSKFRRAPGKSRRPRRVAFDASKILEEHGQHEFGTCELRELHLSRMSRRDGEYYIAEHVVDVASMLEGSQGRADTEGQNRMEVGQGGHPDDHGQTQDNAMWEDEPGCG